MDKSLNSPLFRRFALCVALTIGTTLVALEAAEVCDEGLVCPSPPVDHACVSGQIYDLETSNPVRAAVPTGAICAAVTAEGPCSIEVAVYDGLSFYQNPSASLPLPANISIDDCGRYVVSDFPVPALGFAIFTADDHTPYESRVLTGVSTSIVSQQQKTAFPVYSDRHITDTAWTTSAGDPFSGQTFSEKGVFAGIFLTGNIPTDGVIIERNLGPAPADDFYFSNLNPFTRTTLDQSQEHTGPNGTALLVNSALQDHGGQGSEPPGCYWPRELGKSVPGAVIVQRFLAEDLSTGLPCPGEFSYMFNDGFESGDTSAWSRSR